MSRRWVRIGFRGRVVVHGVTLVILLALCIAIGGRFVVFPEMREAMAADQRTMTMWLVHHGVTALEDRGALAAQLDSMHSVRTDVSVYGIEGQLIGSNVSPPIPLEASAAGSSTADIARPGRPAPIPIRRGPTVIATAMVRVAPPPPPPTSHALVLLGACIVAAVLASIPLARSVVRPLEALTGAARRLGDGDLSARVGLERSDELGDLARAFDEMATRVAALVSAEKELLANVSHELRTPLARMQVVLELASEGDPARVRRYLSEIAQDLAELDRLIEDVLTTARLDAADKQGTPQMPLHRETFAVAEVVERAGARFSRMYPERALELVVGDELPALTGDSLLFRRMLDNLLDNAVKHAPGRHPIELAVRRLTEAVWFQVTDRGPGMSRDDAARAFEPFFRSDTSRRQRIAGVGLGLSIVRRVAEAHGGDVSLETALGKGTSVLVRIPCSPPRNVRSPDILHQADAGAQPQSPKSIELAR